MTFRNDQPAFWVNINIEQKDTYFKDLLVFETYLYSYIYIYIYIYINFHVFQKF